MTFKDTSLEVKILTKNQSLEYAVDMGWTKADAGRAFKGIVFPVEEILLLNKMIQFAGPELVHRQYLQGAQKSQVTRNKNLREKLEKEHQEMIEHYEDKIERDRGLFVGIIRVVYSFARAFGYREPWIDALLATYDQSQKAQAEQDNQAA